MNAIKSRLARFGEMAAQLAFPATCGGCRRIVSQPGTLCPDCWQGLQLLEKPWCEIYGTPFAHDMGEGFLSAEAIAKPPPFRRLRSAVAYEGVAKRMAQNLKYHDRTDLAPWMARWMIRAGADLIGQADVIVPVPLHWRRFLARRFNQSAELARSIACLTGLDYAPEAVIRERATKRQVGLAFKERESNVRGAFHVPEAMDIRIRGRHILVIDDVYTTGATVFAITRALLRHRAAGVDVLTFARVIITE
jgi:ComF family protein